MQSAIKTRKRHIHRLIISFILSLVVFSTAYVAGATHSVEMETRQYQALADGWVESAQDRIGTILTPVLSLEAGVGVSAGGAQDFPSAAWNYIKQMNAQHGVKLNSVLLAPNGVVEHIYPLEGNEHMVGINLQDQSRIEHRVVLATQRKGSATMYAPVAPHRQQTSISICMPLLQQTGVAMVNMDVREFVAMLPLKTLQSVGAVCDLEYVDHSNQHWTLIDTGLKNERSVESTFTLLGVQWTLRLAPEAGWVPMDRFILNLFMIILLSVLVSLVVWDQYNLRDNNRNLQQMAYFDALTLCRSRQYVNMVLVDAATGQWQDPESCYSLAIVDLDRLKSINDQNGHEMGDRALAAVARVIYTEIRSDKGDCVIRHGGDEFVVLMNGVGFKEFKARLSNIVEGVREVEFPDRPDFSISVSIGGEVHSRSNNMCYEEMLNRADKKLYRAKTGGRDRCII